ncbi:MAG: YciI family protein [Steroidobacteraceae bacterium]
MQYLLLVYSDPALMEQLPAECFNTEMRQCLQHADEMTREGTLLAARQLQPASTAKTVRTRAGKTQVIDGPFAETKEVLAGFNLIEASSMEEAVKRAQEFPWTRYGSIEVRPVGDMEAMRRRVGA